MFRRPQILIASLGAAALLLTAACGSNSAAGSSSTSSSTSSSAAAPASAAASSAATSGPATSGPATSGAAASGAATSGAATSGASSAAAGGAIAGCTPTDLKTKASGKLTVATDDPAYEPWFSNNDPTNGKGYESAVAYAVAEKLGFTKDQVTWTRIKFNAAISPAPKDFDFDINQFSISDDRKKAVDFSSGYYDVTQAVVTTKDSSIAKVTTVAGLKGARLGAQIGTTSLTALNDQIAPTTKATVFQTNDAAVQALKNKQIDGIVLDLPTAFYASAAQLDNGVLVGQLPQAGSSPEQFGLLLEKGSSLTDCASKAVDALRADGTLDKLKATWLTGAGAPELK